MLYAVVSIVANTITELPEINSDGDSISPSQQPNGDEEEIAEERDL